MQRQYRLGDRAGRRVWRRKVQDEVESNALYNLLEKELIPLFYNRGADGLPRAWISKMKTSMREICPVFNTNRMVKEYAENYYFPAHSRYSALTDEKLKRTKALAAWRAKVRQNWAGIKIIDVTSGPQKGIKVGESLDVHANIDLGALTPEDVTVEFTRHAQFKRGDRESDGTLRWSHPENRKDGCSSSSVPLSQNRADDRVTPFAFFRTTRTSIIRPSKD